MKKGFFLVCFSLIATSLTAQINFFKMFGGEQYDYGYDIAQTADSGYLITGRSGSFSIGHSDAFLLKISKSGFYEWSAPFGGVENDASYEMLYKPNFGIYLIGSSNSWSAGDYDTYLAFTDESGNLMWEKTFEGPDWEEGVEAAFTLDTGMIVGVNRTGTNTWGQDISLMRLDLNGDTVWTKDFSFEGDEEITNVERYRDSLFVISSNRYNAGTASKMAHLLLLHQDGTIVWEDTLGVAAGDYTINDFFISNDTLFGIGGYRQDDTTATDICYYRHFVDPTNYYNVQSFAIHSAADWEGDVLTNYNNSSYRYGAYNVQGSFTTPGGTDVHIGRHLYTLGWLTGVGYIDFEGSDRMYEGIPTSDGGAIMVGYTSGGSGGASIAVVKIGDGEVYPTIAGVTYVDQLVGLKQNEVLSNFQLYPNPAQTELMLVTELTGASEYTIITTDGKRILEGTLSGTNTTISLDGFVSGVYFLQLHAGMTCIGTQQFVVR